MMLENKYSSNVVSTKQIQYKVAFVFVLLLFTIIFSFIPIIFVYFTNKNQITDGSQNLEIRRKKRMRKNVVSLLNCFASGVFISVCLLDLLPEVEEKFEVFIKSSVHFRCTTFPLAQFFIIVGFLTLLIIEHLASFCKGTSHNEFHYDHGHHDVNSLVSSTASIVSHHTPHHHPQQHHQQAQQLPAEIFLSRSTDYNSLYSRTNNNHIIEDNVSNISGFPNRRSESEPMLTRDDVNILLEIEEDEMVEKSTDPSAHSHFRYIMLAVVLSIHSVFEGLALGLETKMSTVVQLFAAIAIHKSVVAFSLGLNMVQSGLSLSSKLTSLSIFCLASPIGAIIGICVELGSVQSAISAGIIGLLQALACGSFIYIVFFELLPHEFFTYRKRPNSFLKILSLVLGLALLSVLMLFGPM